MNTSFTPNLSTALGHPIYMSTVEADFSSPAEDYVDGTLDLNKHLINCLFITQLPDLKLSKLLDTTC